MHAHPSWPASLSLGRPVAHPASRRPRPHHRPGTDPHAWQDDGSGADAHIVLDDRRLRVILLVVDDRILVICHRHVRANEDPVADPHIAGNEGPVLNSDIVSGHNTSADPGAGPDHVAPAQPRFVTDGRELPDDRPFSQDH